MLVGTLGPRRFRRHLASFENVAGDVKGISLAMAITAGVIVLDVGKTVSKATLWAPDGQLVRRLTRPNAAIQTARYRALDAAGIEEWLVDALAQLAPVMPVSDIVPVGHGAAMALIGDRGLLIPPVDYEQAVPAEIVTAYRAQRDSFRQTGSPALPDGLNGGLQLHWLESVAPEAFTAGTQILPWPQYWAWVLCGVAASEVSSLGCHSDLWFPWVARASSLSERRGWAANMAPLRGASEALGLLRGELARRTGLPPSTRVRCGLHDSNGALLAARAYPELSERESTVLSTGTWFVALRTPGSSVTANGLREDRDCLINVDVNGRPVPSARFMGGREIEQLTSRYGIRIDDPAQQAGMVAAVPEVLAQGLMILPSFVAGCGPFPAARGLELPDFVGITERLAATGLYAALMADVLLGLIDSRERLLVEGRFAEVEVFVRALASLRPGQAVYVANSATDVSFGALQLLDGSLRPPGSLRRVDPLDCDLGGLRNTWRNRAEALERAA